MKVTQITIKIYLKWHLLPSYAVTFESEEKADNFVTYINNDVDYIQIGNEVIKRTKIRKMVFKYA